VTHDAQLREVKDMPGTRTAPDVTLTETYGSLSISLVDADNGETTVTLRTASDATLAEYETLIDALQVIANGSIWRVENTAVYEGAKSKANALDESYVSVKDVIRLSAKNVTDGAYIRAYAPSPLGDLIGDNASVDTTNASYTAWRDAVSAVLPAGFTLLNVAFVQNVERNKGESPVA
jgi:hypothetical protein